MVDRKKPVDQAKPMKIVTRNQDFRSVFDDDVYQPVSIACIAEKGFKWKKKKINTTTAIVAPTLDATVHLEPFDRPKSYVRIYGNTTGKLDGTADPDDYKNDQSTEVDLIQPDMEFLANDLGMAQQQQLLLALDGFEKATKSFEPINFDDAVAVCEARGVQLDQDAIERVYNHWLERRRLLNDRPIIRRFWPVPRDDNQEMNVVFRSRIIRQQKKKRKTFLDVAASARTLEQNLIAMTKLPKFLKQRDEKKIEHQADVMRQFAEFQSATVPGSGTAQAMGGEKWKPMPWLEALVDEQRARDRQVVKDASPGRSGRRGTGNEPTTADGTPISRFKKQQQKIGAPVLVPGVPRGFDVEPDIETGPISHSWRLRQGAFPLPIRKGSKVNHWLDHASGPSRGVLEEPFTWHALEEGSLEKIPFRRRTAQHVPNRVKRYLPVAEQMALDQDSGSDESDDDIIQTSLWIRARFDAFKQHASPDMPLLPPPPWLKKFPAGLGSAAAAIPTHASLPTPSR